MKDKWYWKLSSSWLIQPSAACLMSCPEVPLYSHKIIGIPNNHSITQSAAGIWRFPSSCVSRKLWWNLNLALLGSCVFGISSETGVWRFMSSCVFCNLWRNWNLALPKFLCVWNLWWDWNLVILGFLCVFSGISGETGIWRFLSFCVLRKLVSGASWVPVLWN